MSDDSDNRDALDGILALLSDIDRALADLRQLAQEMKDKSDE